MANPTLLDIAVRNLSDAGVGLINETGSAHPEVQMAAARTIAGLNYYTRVRTGLPAGDFWRGANEGSTPGKSTVVNRLVECFIFNPRWECDKAIADAAEDGATAYILEEAEAVMEAAMQNLAAQFYYGTGNSAKGCPGLLAAVDSSMEVDAGGNSAKTSVWGVRWGRKNVEWVVGQGGQFAMSDIMTERLVDANSKPYTGYVQELLSRIGLQVGSIYSIGRIKNIEEDTKTLTDDMISDLLALFPAGAKPDVLLMNRRSLKQLQQSRTATNPTGAPAPFPDSAFGVPIAVTDAITNSES